MQITSRSLTFFYFFIPSSSTVSLGQVFDCIKNCCIHIYILLIAIVHFLRKKGPHTACTRLFARLLGRHGMDHFHLRALSSCKCAYAAGHFLYASKLSSFGLSSLSAILIKIYFPFLLLPY